MNSKKILFLSTQLPYPPKSGGTIKSWNYVEHLAKSNSLTVACLLKENDEDFVEEFRQNVKLENFIGKKLNIGRNGVNLLKSYLFSASLNVFRNFSNEFAKKVQEASKNAEVIVVDHYEVFQYVPNNFKGKVILHTHNAEFMLWQRMSELEMSNPIKKLILKWEANRVKRYEKKIFDQSNLIYSTPSDIELYKNSGFDVSKHAITYHLGNDKLLELPKLEFEATDLALTFMGTLSWEPNIDGLLWFIRECWPKIIDKHPKSKLYVLGAKPDNRIVDAAQAYNGIEFTGFVKELEKYLSKTRVFLVPLRFGSGMKVKVLDGLYRGVPMVSTSVGAEGLEVRNTHEIMIADEADEFANHCIRLLEDQKLWCSLRDKSRIVGKDKYRWETLFQSMEKAFNQLNP